MSFPGSRPLGKVFLTGDLFGKGSWRERIKDRSSENQHLRNTVQGCTLKLAVSIPGAPCLGISEEPINCLPELSIQRGHKLLVSYSDGGHAC